jgi:hypothetical protein
MEAQHVPKLACVMLLSLAPAAISALGCGGGHGEPALRATAHAPAPRVDGAERKGVTAPQGTGEGNRTTNGDGDEAERNATPSTITCTEGAAAAIAVPAPGAVLGVRPDGSGVAAEAIAVRGGMIQVPAWATLTSRAEVSEIAAFPEEVKPASGSAAKMAEAPTAARGTRRTYTSELSYERTVDFFDRTLVKYGFQSAQRMTSDSATMWRVRCPGAETAAVAVRDGKPPTIEVVEGEVK